MSNSAGVQSNIKQRRAKAVGAKHRSSIQLYNKLSDLVGTLSELISMQELTDTIILQVSSMFRPIQFIGGTQSEVQSFILRLCISGIYPSSVSVLCGKCQ